MTEPHEELVSHRPKDLDIPETHRLVLQVPLGNELIHVLDRSGPVPVPVAAAGRSTASGLGASAIELGRLDELRMFREPVVVGGGTPFWPPVTEDIPLDLVETRTFGSRVLFERYGRAAIRRAETAVLSCRTLGAACCTRREGLVRRRRG